MNREPYYSWWKMPSTKHWYFDLKLGGLRGISVVRDGKELPRDKFGPISRVSTPSTRKLCTQAKDFLDQAVQVIEVYIL